MSLRREWLSLILGAILILLALNAILRTHGPRDLLALRAHRHALETRRERLVADNAELRTNVQKLRSDNHYLETVIRRELGYARPNELVYKFGTSSPKP
jgi:cell division protein FtsB